MILVCDDRDSYFEVLEKVYEPFKATCATRVDSLKASLDELDRSATVGFGEVPVLQKEEGLVILERVEGDDADLSISMSDCSLLGGLQQPQVEKLESLFAPVQKGFAIDRSNIAKLQIEGDKIKEEHERRNQECPKLVIDWDNDSASVNGKPLSCRQFENDASCIVEFVNSFQLFSGDVEGYQSDAWKIVVWYFATPFFSHLRKECILAQQEGLLISLPMFLFLYGDANAGKTSLFKFLGKAMCGSVVEPLEGASFKDGSPLKTVRVDSIRKPRLMQVNQKGLPILYDDVARGQMTDSPLRKLLTTPYAKTLDMEYDGYPAVVATSNITPPMPQEFQKRALFFQVSASLNQKQAIKNGQIPNRLTDEVGSSFFAEYVKRAAPKFKEHSRVDAIGELDVYEIFSGVILDIVRESGHSPKWATPLCIDDYFGESAMCHRAAKNLKRYFTASRESFERNTEENQLIVRCSSGDRNAENALKGIEMMLPPRFQSEFSPGMLTCNLLEIEKLYGMKFSRKAGWFHRFVK